MWPTYTNFVGHAPMHLCPMQNSALETFAIVFYVLVSSNIVILLNQWLKWHTDRCRGTQDEAPKARVVEEHGIEEGYMPPPHSTRGS